MKYYDITFHELSGKTSSSGASHQIKQTLMLGKMLVSRLIKSSCKFWSMEMRYR